MARREYLPARDLATGMLAVRMPWVYDAARSRGLIGRCGDKGAWSAYTNERGGDTMDETPRVGTRLSTTATTGWTDWFHGELWLFQDGILRVPIGWLKSICCVGYVAELRNPMTRAFSAEEFSRLIAHRRNLWLPRWAIASAVLRHNVFGTHDLRVQMSDGRTFQLLTLPSERICVPLQIALQEWLGEAFVSDPVAGPVG